MKDVENRNSNIGNDTLRFKIVFRQFQLLLLAI